MSALNGEAAAVVLLKANHFVIVERSGQRVELRYQPPGMARPVRVGRGTDLVAACEDALNSGTADPSTGQELALPRAALFVAMAFAEDLTFLFNTIETLFPGIEIVGLDEEDLDEEDDFSDGDGEEREPTPQSPRGQVFTGDFGQSGRRGSKR